MADHVRPVGAVRWTVGFPGRSRTGAARRVPDLEHIIIAAIARIFFGVITGQASTLVLVLFLGGVQLIFLGILGEYLGRIYDEVRARPLYIVREVLGEKTDRPAPRHPTASAR